MTRAYNFGAGPAMLPAEILLEAQQELLNWQSLGISILEVGHRTTAFQNLLNTACSQLKELLSIPDNYQILFLGAPARLQFSSIPLNFISSGQQACYWVTGLWSSTAYEEARRLRDVTFFSSDIKETMGFNGDSLPENTAYFYFTPNETVNGIRDKLPKLPKNIPVIADMTSCLLTEPITVNQYSLIFAGAQKNLANAGLTLVIVKDEFLATIKNNKLPSFLDYRVHAVSQSLFCTPPTFNCYLAQKMFTWIKNKGGINSLYLSNQQKSQLLYNYIDGSNFYHCDIPKSRRSLVNVCFNLYHIDLTELFIKEASNQQLIALEGHRTVGGLRASIYNAMPMEGVEYLIQFMTEFADRYKEFPFEN